jgi:hypothetical protein
MSFRTQSTRMDNQPSVPGRPHPRVAYPTAGFASDWVHNIARWTITPNPYCRVRAHRFPADPEFGMTYDNVQAEMVMCLNHCMLNNANRGTPFATPPSAFSCVHQLGPDLLHVCRNCRLAAVSPSTSSRFNRMRGSVLESSTCETNKPHVWQECRQCAECKEAVYTPVEVALLFRQT